jgi:hypothetical protein
MYNKPKTILDYLFMYSYVISIIGAIFFSIYNVLNIDGLNILFNRNISVILGYYLFFCGYIAFCVWWEMPILKHINCSRNILTGELNCQDNTIYVDRTHLYIASYFINTHFNRNVVITKLN